MRSSAGACVLELAEDGYKNASVAEAEKLLLTVPTLIKKIAGKSLPIEVSCKPVTNNISLPRHFLGEVGPRLIPSQKLANRKVRKFESQNKHLFLPAMDSPTSTAVSTHVLGGCYYQSTYQESINTSENWRM